MFFKLINQVEINPTELCNLTCNFCPRATFYPNKNTHMDINVAIEIKNQLLAANFQGTISITGRGEPTLHPKFEELCSVFIGHGWRLKTNTNGKRFEKFERFILDNFHEIQYNCYTHTEEQVSALKQKYINHPNIYFTFKPENTSWFSPERSFTNRAGSFPTNQLSEDKRCEVIFQKMFIDVDGTYRLCCEDWKEKVALGNIFETTIEDHINNNKQLMNYRHDLANGIRKLKPCVDCSYCVTSKARNRYARFDKVYALFQEMTNKIAEK